MSNENTTVTSGTMDHDQDGGPLLHPSDFDSEMEDVTREPDALRIMSQMEIIDGEDTLAYAARVEKQLAKDAPSGKLTLKNTKRPREYNAKSLSDDTREYLHRAHVSYRVAFGLYLNQDPISAILNKVFSDFPGSVEAKENAQRIAWDRLRNLCSSWKNKTICRLEDHVRELVEQDEILARCKDLGTLHHFLKPKFDPDNWSEIMEPWKKTVNVRASKPDVHRWCRSLYVDLGARIKLYLDWQKTPASERPAEYIWDREAILMRFDSLTRASAYRDMRPPRSSIIMNPEQSGGRKKKRVKREVELIDPEFDPDIFIDGDD